MRSVRRIPVEDRWGPDCVGWVRHVPWNRYSGDEQADGDVPESRSVDVPERNGKERQEQALPVKVKGAVPREFQIRRKMLRDSDIRRDAGVVAAGFGDWRGNPIRMRAERGSEKQ